MHHCKYALPYMSHTDTDTTHDRRITSRRFASSLAGLVSPTKMRGPVPLPSSTTPSLSLQQLLVALSLLLLLLNVSAARTSPNAMETPLVAHHRNDTVLKQLDLLTISAGFYQNITFWPVYTGSCINNNPRCTLTFNVNFTSTSSTAVLNVWLTGAAVYEAWLANNRIGSPSSYDWQSCPTLLPLPLIPGNCAGSTFRLAVNYSQGAVMIIQNADPNPQASAQVVLYSFVNAAYNSFAVTSSHHVLVLLSILLHLLVLQS
jgi:hypothetical protein